MRANNRVVRSARFRAALRRALATLHLTVGLTVGMLVAVLGLSGSLLVFRPEIERALDPAVRRAQPDGRAPAPLQVVLAQAERARPGVPVTHLFVAPGPEDTHEIWYRGDERRVYVDPYTAAVRGQREAGRTPFGWLTLLHTHLLSGETGERVVGWGGVGLLGLAASGLFLWWPVRLRQFGERVRVRWRGGTRRAAVDLHRAGGFWTAAFLLLAAATGIALAFTEWTAATVYRAAGTSPPPKPKAPKPPSDASILPLGNLLTRADAALPGGVVRRVTFPGKAGQPLVVRKRFPGEAHPNGINYIYLDPATGAVLRVDAAARAGGPRRLLDARYPLHIGRWGGTATRLLHAAGGLMPAVLYATGVYLWWTKRRARRGAAAVTRP